MSKKVVLHLDRNHEWRRIVITVLREEFEVISCSDLSDAEAKARELNPDIYLVEPLCEGELNFALRLHAEGHIVIFLSDQMQAFLLGDGKFVDKYRIHDGVGLRNTIRNLLAT